jgi:hypothetical protein
MRGQITGGAQDGVGILELHPESNLPTMPAGLQMLNQRLAAGRLIQRFQGVEQVDVLAVEIHQVRPAIPLDAQYPQIDLLGHHRPTPEQHGQSGGLNDAPVKKSIGAVKAIQIIRSGTCPQLLKQKIELLKQMLSVRVPAQDGKGKHLQLPPQTRQQTLGFNLSHGQTELNPDCGSGASAELTMAV